jgi:hypothetical protein
MSDRITTRDLTCALFLGRDWQDDHQVGERVMAGVVMERVPASLAEQQKHPFSWTVASDSRIDRAAMFPDGCPSAYVYWDDNPGRRSITLSLSSDEAEQIAKELARTD